MALVRNPSTGEVGITDDPTAYLEQGWVVATPEEAQSKARELDYGTGGQQLQAQAERVVRGGTFGLVEGFGDDPEAIRARAEVSQELSPVTSFAADLAPDLAVGLVSGGLGGLVTGAGRTAARQAGGGLLKAGLAAARAAPVAALAAESVATGAVAAGQQAFAEGREAWEDIGRDAENALIWGGVNLGLGGAGLALGALKGRRLAKALDDAPLELDDTMRAAEARHAANMPEEALPGPAGLADEAGATGDGIPLTSDPAVQAKVAERQASKVPAAVAEKEAVEDGLDRGLRKASRAEADDIVERAVGKAEPEASSVMRQRRLYQNRTAIVDVATKEMQRDLTDVVREVRDLSGPKKLASVSKNVGDNLPAQRAAARSIADEAAKFAGELKAEAKAYAAASGKKGLQYAAKGGKDFNLALMDHAKELASAKTGKDMFEALNTFKQAADEYKLSFEAGAINSDNPIHINRLIPKVQDFASKIRKSLEDVPTWGKAGEMQGAYNAVIHDRLLPSMRVFEESVMKKTHKGYDALWQMEGWENKIRGLLEHSDTGERRHVASVLDAMQELASAESKFGGGAGKSIVDKVDKIRRTIKLADEVADASNRMGGLAGVAGAVPLVGGFAKEFVSGDLMANMRRLTGATDAAVSRSVDDWIASSRVRGRGIGVKLPKLLPQSAEGKQIAAVTKRLGISQGLARFMGEDENPTAAFEKKREALMDEDRFLESLGQDYRSLQAEAPEAYMLVSARAAGDRQFLLDRMPANVAVSMMRPSGYPPSRESIEDFAVYWNALQDPIKTVSNLAAIRVQELEAIKERRPRLYEQVQNEVIQRIGEAQSAGEPLDDSLLMRLDLLFGLDGAGSTAFSYQAARMANEASAEQQQAMPKGKPPGPPKPTGIAATAQSGATFGQGP